MPHRPLHLTSFAAPPPRLPRNAHAASLIALPNHRRQLAPGAAAILRKARGRDVQLADVLLSHGLAAPPTSSRRRRRCAARPSSTRPSTRPIRG